MQNLALDFAIIHGQPRFFLKMERTMKKMQKILLAFFACFLTIAFTADDAEARRIGGGRSFGMQRNISKSPTRQAPAQNQAAAQPKKNSWAGPLAGLAAGLGLGMLASHLGLGEGFGSVLLILLLVAAAAFVFSMLAKKRKPQALAFAANGQQSSARPFENLQPAGSANVENFNAAEFVRHAKVNFIRLQAANDAMNAADIREFVSPEVFAEIKMDWDERGNAPQETDVQNLNAEVLDVSEEADRYIVSVLFSGKIKEDKNAASEPFSEIWHMTKAKNGGGWVVAGIEQSF